MKLNLLFLLSTIFLLGQCTKDESSPLPKENNTSSTLTYCDTVTVSFSSQIQPIFNQNCSTSGCHDSNTAAAGYMTENYTEISSNAAKYLKTIKHQAGCSPMPKFQPKLADSLITQLECWISQGKLNN